MQKAIIYARFATAEQLRKPQTELPEKLSRHNIFQYMRPAVKRGEKLL